MSVTHINECDMSVTHIHECHMSVTHIHECHMSVTHINECHMSVTHINECHMPPKNGLIALLLTTNGLMCSKCVSQKRNEAIDNCQWYT